MGSAAPLYEAGEYAQVAGRLGALVAAAPQYPMLFYNLACCESRCGRVSDALDHLRHAIEKSQELNTVYAITMDRGKAFWSPGPGPDRLDRSL